MTISGGSTIRFPKPLPELLWRADADGTRHAFGVGPTALCGQPWTQAHVLHGIRECEACASVLRMLVAGVVEPEAGG